jgi:hypothetical protein
MSSSHLFFWRVLRWHMFKVSDLDLVLESKEILLIKEEKELVMSIRDIRITLVIITRREGPCPEVDDKRS